MVNTKNMKYNKEVQIKRTPCYINLRCNNINYRVVFSTIEVESLNVDSCDFRCVIFSVKPSLIAFDEKKSMGLHTNLTSMHVIYFLKLSWKGF